MEDANCNLPPTPPAAPHRHGAHHALLFGLRRIPRRNWWLGALASAGLIAGIVVVLVFTGWDLAEVMAAIGRLHPVPLVLAMATLPLFGFPIMPVYLVAGARFGALFGGLVVAVATAVHLLGTYVIARTVLRAPLRRLLSRWHLHLPEIPRDEEAAIALIAVLVPGLPYFVRNYLLAMAGLRLRVYFWICLPIYVARSYVSILLGDLGASPSGRRLLILAAVETVKVVICGVVIWWLREHHRRVHGAAAVVPPRASS